MQNETTFPERGYISKRHEKWITFSAVATMLIVAVSSAVLSFDGLRRLALASSVPEELAFLFPITIDATILMGSLAVLRYELYSIRTAFGWFTVIFGTTLSVVGNVISVNGTGMTAQVLHGIIPILLCISLESLLRILRFNIRRQVETPEHATAQTPARTITEDDPERIATTASASTETVEESPSEAVRDTKLHTHSDPAPLLAPSSTPTVSVAVSEVPSYSERDEIVDEESNPTETVVASSKYQEQTPFFLEVAKEHAPQSSELNAEDESEPFSPTNPPPAVSPILDDANEPTLPSVSEGSPTTSGESTSESTPKAKGMELKASSVAVTTSASGATTRISNLSASDIEKLSAVVKKLPVDMADYKKLGVIMGKVERPISAKDVRLIMGYESNKRVDTMVRRAKNVADTLKEKN